MTERVAVLRNLKYGDARRLAFHSEATIGRTDWDHRSKLMLREGGLVLVRGDTYYPWEPKGVDIRKADWLAVLPLADA